MATLKAQKPVNLAQLRDELEEAGFPYLGLNGSGEAPGGEGDEETVIHGVIPDPANPEMGVSVEIPPAAQKVLDAHVARFE